MTTGFTVHTVLGVVALAFALPFVLAQTPLPGTLASAHAEEFALSRVVVLDTLNNRLARPAFSSDGRRLAFLHHKTPFSDDLSTLVVVALPDATRVRTVEFKRQTNGIGWSSDGDSIFVVDTAGDGYVVAVATGKVTPLGAVKVPQFGGEIIWPDTRYIYFFSSDHIEERSQRLDLETLSTGRIPGPESAAATAARLRKTPIDHPFVVLRKSSVPTSSNGTIDAMTAFNRDESFERVLFPEFFQFIAFSPDASCAVIEDFGRVRLLISGTRSRPRLMLEATLTPLPNPIEASDTAEIRARLSRGQPVYADVFTPRLNPLNQRLVGSEGRSKGRVRIMGLRDDGKIEARLVLEISGYLQAGDVIQNFWTPETKEANFRSHAGSAYSHQFKSVAAVVETLK